MTTYDGLGYWREHPPKWPTVPLRKVARLGTGHTPSRLEPDYWVNCTVPWVTTADLTARTDGGLQPLMETTQHVSELGLANSAAVLHPTDTVMLSRTASIGHSVRIGRPMATTQAFVTWTCGPQLDPRYLLLVMNAMKPEFDRLAYGSTHLTIYFPDIEQLRVPLPPVHVQSVIADYLDTETARIDALIEKKQRMIELANLRWRRKLLDVLAPHLGDGSAPKDWVPGRLRNLVDRVVGGSWGAEPGETSFNAPCVRAADFDFPRLSAKGGALRSYGLSEMQSRVVRTGDLVIEKSGGGDEAPVGRVVMWLGKEKAVPTNFAARLRSTDAHDPWFVLLTFRAAYDAGLNWRSIKQTTGIQNLDTGAYLSEPWPIPPIDVQRQLAADLRSSLDSTINFCEVLHRQVDLLRERRQALITAAVTGEFEVPGVAA